MNFFDIVSSHLKGLSDNDHKLFDFVVKNMDEINGKSIREVASLCYVSTATFLRFVRKIGFSGYSEFTTVIKFTLMNNQEEKSNPFTVPQTTYRNEYLKNIDETVRVLKADQLKQIAAKLADHPNIFLFAKDTTKHLESVKKFV